MTSRKFALYTVALGLLFSAGCQQDRPTPLSVPTQPIVATPKAPAMPSPQNVGGLVRIVDRSNVCMVNNQDMGKPQIAIEVEGRTYFGCCDMCKTRLAQDATSRFAVDPVSNKSVDKSIAIIGRKPDGAVMYFENEANFRSFSSSAGAL